MSEENAQPSRREFLRQSAGAGLALAGFPLRMTMGAETVKAPPGSKGSLRWRAHDVAKIPDGYQVAVADVSGNGRLDILALSSERNIVDWYENPSWRARPITTGTQKNISLTPLVWKGYTGHGLALAAEFYLDDSSRGGSLWWTEPGDSPDSEWKLYPIDEIPTSHRLRWADLDGDGRPELLDVPLLGAGAKAPDYNAGTPITCFRIPEAVWHGRTAEPSDKDLRWTPHRIDDSLTVVHGVCVFDWDDDGRDEFLTASFEGIHLFRSSGRGENLRWSKKHLAAGDQVSHPRRGSSEIGVGKVGGRRYLATIEPWHGEQVVVYFESEHGGLWKRQVIDSSFHDGHALACADFDGDGNDEIVAGYRGPGTSLYLYHARGASGEKWERQTLDEKMAAACVVVADVNGDGRLDVVAVGASTGNVKWYENFA